MTTSECSQRTERLRYYSFVVDLNAKIRDVKTGYEQVMGVHWIKKMNENGELFSDFCAQTVWLLGAVCSNTGAFIKQRGDRLIT